MKIYGLLGKNIGHSFSPAYFQQKWQTIGRNDCVYNLYPVADESQIPTFLQQKIDGFNVTIPYKKAIIPYLDELSAAARAVGAVNTVVIRNNRKIGYNTDVLGFEKSLLNCGFLPAKGLILGTGGAAAAVAYVLDKLGINFRYVSRQKADFCLNYEDINADILAEYPLIINTSPLGMWPNVETAPDLPYHLLSSAHLLFDLVYNPVDTLFLQKGQAQNCRTKGGLEMLHEQAEAAWAIWQGEKI